MVDASASHKIDPLKAVRLLEPGGPLSLILKDYEFRSRQQNMLEDVISAYNENRIALIEAGTGLGKSMAYLIPALLWSAQNKERTLISTNTISLQEQLLHKDIPLVSKIVGFQVKAVLVKGMGNYVCMRKLEEAEADRNLCSESEKKELDAILHWNGNTHDGSLSSLPIVPSSATWERVCVEGDSCTRKRCPFYSKCWFFKARKEAEEAHILIANHAMLFSDLAYKSENPDQDEIGLPSYSRIILDEAHHIEKAATDFFADRVSHLQLVKQLSRLGADKQGKLAGLTRKFITHFIKEMPHEAARIHSLLSIDLPGLRKNILQLINEAFDAILTFLQTSLDIPMDSLSGELKLRILEKKHLEVPAWKNEIIPRSESLIAALNKYIQTICSMNEAIARLNYPKVIEQTMGVRNEIQACALRLEHIKQALENFMKVHDEKAKVKWVQANGLRSGINTQLFNADLDISKKLRDFLFGAFPTVILCSATLTTGQTFTFLRSRLGVEEKLLPNKTIMENIYPSPFDYEKQTLLLVASDMPVPSDPHFCEAACGKIWSSIQASHGNAFVLFTSYTMMQECYNILQPKLIEKRFIPFKQGDANRKVLLEKYKAADRSVLFGTDSFWEGIDVAGEALRCVIIVKLPFKVPSDPLIEARAEAILEKGGNPFYEYAIPQAIVKFKQGFGRLIRNKKDRGCIVCLDARLISKPYGLAFLQSLPKCGQSIVKDSEHLRAEMEKFYKIRRSLY